MDIQISELIHTDYDYYYLHNYERIHPYEREGVCGIFLQNECMYIFSANNIFSGLYYEAKSLVSKPDLKYTLLKPHIPLLQCYVLEFNQLSKPKWLQYYNYPIFNSQTPFGLQKFQGSAQDLADFVSGKITIEDLRLKTYTPSKTQGVYLIRNKENNKLYIGSSQHIESRWKEHLYNLKNGIHHSWKLQLDYKSPDQLEFKIIEVVENKYQLRQREQYWIDYYDSANKGYNCAKRTDYIPGHNP